jgi:predicted dehydrogenase
MLNVGLIGVGYWGPNLCCNFIANPNTHMQICCDLNGDRLKYINSLYPAQKSIKNRGREIKL